MNSSSKSISKWDDSAKLLVIQLLWWDKTWGFDLDSVYCVNGHYYIIEFLKCESNIPWVTPFTSHPNRYRFNKQKFISLRNITQRLKWTLYLINYEMINEKAWDRFKLMKVLSLDEEKGIETDDKLMDFKNMQKRWKDLNNSALK